MTRAEVTAPSPSLDERISRLGGELWRLIGDEAPGVFDRARWEGRLLDWVMEDPGFRTDLFRFIDVLPSLQDPAQVLSHLREYLLPHTERLKGLLGAGLRVAEALAGGIGAALAARTVRTRVGEMADRFIVGTNATASLPRLRELHDQGFASTVDLLGEAVLGETEAAACRARYLDLIERLPAASHEWAPDPVADEDHQGPLPRANVSVKVSGLECWLDPVDTAGSVARLAAAAMPLCLAARERGAFLHLDMEHWDLHGITLDLFEGLALDPRLRDWPHLGITVQAYLRSARRDVDRLASIAAARGTPFAVRLVKGAYWDVEVARARQRGTPCPVHTEKAATDASYEELTALLLRQGDRLAPAFAGHNLRSLTHALALAQELGRPDGALELQTLYGMAEPERRALRSLGRRVRVYAPVGELLPGMAYLVRRLLENTSNTSFLRLRHRERVEPRILLAKPVPPLASPPVAPEGFANCPLTDFTEPASRAAYAEALTEASAALPLTVPIVVGGRERFGGETLERLCPDDGRVAAVVTAANRADVSRAVALAEEAWPSWRDRTAGERAALLMGLASRLEADRWRLAALQTLEVAKPWREADSDVAEAADYCRYYARQAPLELGPRSLGRVPGESNRLWYEGRGVTAVIAPWNFPVAILCGMTAAALVAGNAVILKPAEQSSAVAHAFFRHLLAAGFPPALVHFLPGPGETVGSWLVEHPRITQIAFTGSMAVGLSIVRAAGQTRPGQRHVKRVVCEMGGKNAVVIDEGADLDEAVAGVLASAFGYAGQKCSACSRVVVVGTAWGPFTARLTDACRGLTPSPAREPSCRLGPVIDADAFERLTAVLRDPEPGAELLYAGTAPGGGWYFPPALFRVAGPEHRLMQEELFGPIVALLHAPTFEEAIEAALSTPYALTASVYSRLPSHLRLAQRRLRVGNLYLNRPCTGAMVGRQPFGGFGMSGLGTKAGGPGYLRHFTDPRCTTENTMRRGFGPGDEASESGSSD